MIKHRLTSIIFFIAILSLGFFSAHRVMFLDGFDKVHGDYGDARFTIILLEHAFSFFQKNNLDSFWDPFWNCYPFPNVLAFAEVFAGNMPLYAVFRFIGFDLMTSYQLWILCCSILNFTAAFFLLWYLGGSNAASLAGSYLFSFSITRIEQFNHSQLLPHYLTVMSLFFAIYFVRNYKKKTAGIALLGAAFFLAWQFWSSVYFGLFATLLYGVMFVTIFSLYRKNISVLSIVLQHKNYLLLSIFVFIVLLFPLFQHYGWAQKVVGYRSWGEINFPRLGNYFLPSQASLLYASFYEIWVKNFSINWTEPFIFSGFLPFLMPFGFLIFFVKYRKKILSENLYQLSKIVLICYFLYFLFTQNPILYRIVYAIPGFGSIRVISRYHLLMLLLIAVMFILFVQIVQENSHRLASFLGFFFLVIVVVENWVARPTMFFSKKDHDKMMAPYIEQLASQDCDAFYVDSLKEKSWAVQNDGLWLSILTRTPTFNCYSGHFPPGYNLYQPSQVTSQSLREWVSLFPDKESQLKKLCLLRL